MLWETINLTGAEVGFAFFTNAEGSSLPADAVVAIMVSATTRDGNKINQPNTNELDLTVGILDQSLADGASGRVQTYGWRTTSKVLTTDTTQGAGLKMVPVAGQDYLASVAAGDGRDGLFVLGASITTSTGTVSRAVFIRCM